MEEKTKEVIRNFLLGMLAVLIILMLIIGILKARCGC